MIEKDTAIRSKKLTQAANGKACVRCKVMDGTVVACHYQGIGSGRLGKGRGRKPHDLFCADLCRRCHHYFDDYLTPNDTDRGWKFLMLICETQVRRVREGIITL